MNTSDIIQLVGIITASLISAISIIISVFTLRQNSKMIEESTRPMISIYAASINPSMPTFYLIVKNFGQTPAEITKFNYDFDFQTMGCYGENAKRDYLQDLVSSTFAPGQSRICRLEYAKVNKPVTFEFEYKSHKKIYTDKATINLKAAVAMPTLKAGETKGTELKAIAYTLQDILHKSL